MDKKNIIMVPYANDKHMRGGVNVNEEKRFEIYMKNCCVALLSAKKYNVDSDVALVTNIDIPIEYRTILEKNNILIINVEFEAFRFLNDYKWGLAFYKLCALKYVAEKYDYEFYAYLDADVYVQSNFQFIWKECEQNILLYDINHGLQVKDYQLFLEDVNEFTKSDKIITQYGGEFFAASRDNAIKFIEECYSIYNKMLKEKYYTRFGDEFILSLAADNTRDKIKNAGAYIFRFWTGSFRLVSTSYRFNPIAVIHVPDEKNCGIIKIYKYFVKKKTLPSLNKMYCMLHLKHRKIKTFIKSILMCLLRKQ